MMHIPPMPPRDDRPAGDRCDVTLRDTFAAAALTGLLSNVQRYQNEPLAQQAFEVAEFMLRERDKISVGAAGAAPVADRKSVAAHGACARSCSQPFDSAPITQPALPCAETDGFSPGSSGGTINRSAERESPRRECGESLLRDVPQLDNSRAAGGPEHHISEAQIDALECVVEDGRIVGMGVYGHLRSLLVRLRPEWESDRSKPISDERLAALEELSALDQELELEHGLVGNPLINAQQRTPPHGSVQGEGSVPDSRTK